MNKWVMIWLPPINGSDLEAFEIILKKHIGVYLWQHESNSQIVYIGETGDSFYQRVYKEEMNLLRNAKWNIYNFEKEPDFANLLKKHSFGKTYMEANMTKKLFIPQDESDAKKIWNEFWKSKVDEYINNLKFFFCTGDWSSDQDNRRHVESKLLWGYKKYYAEKAGLPDLKKDDHRISIGKIQDPGLADQVTFRHVGCVESIPKKVLEFLK